MSDREGLYIINGLGGSGGPGVPGGQPPNVFTVKTGPGRLIKIISMVPNTTFAVYDAATSAQMVGSNLIIANGGGWSWAGPYGVTPGEQGGGGAVLPNPITEIDVPVVNGIMVSMPDNAGGPISVIYD